jgi:hypothetical protein
MRGGDNLSCFGAAISTERDLTRLVAKEVANCGRKETALFVPCLQLPRS